MTVLIGCSKTPDVATNGSTTTVGTNKPAAASGTTVVTEAGTSTTKKAGATTTTEATGSSTTTASKSSTTTTSTDDSTPPSSGKSTTTTNDTPVVVADVDKPLCEKIKQLNAEFKDLDPTKDPQAISKIKDAFKGLVEVAPPDIKPTLEDYAKAFENINTIQDFSKLETDPSLKADSDKMTSWEKTHCGT